MENFVVSEGIGIYVRVLDVRCWMLDVCLNIYLYIYLYTCIYVCMCVCACQ